MKTLTGKIARIVFAIPLGVFGLFHFMNGKQMAQFLLPGWPAAEVLVYISGLGLLMAAISITINKYARLASYLLVIELAIFIFAIHVPGLANPDTMQMAMSGLLKDMAIAGGGLMIAANQS